MHVPTQVSRRHSPPLVRCSLYGVRCSLSTCATASALPHLFHSSSRQLISNSLSNVDVRALPAPPQTALA